MARKAAAVQGTATPFFSPSFWWDTHIPLRLMAEVVKFSQPQLANTLTYLGTASLMLGRRPWTLAPSG